MLENASHIAGIAGQIVAVLAVFAIPIVRLFTRVQKLESRDEEKQKVIEGLSKQVDGFNSLGERLARIETLLEVLIGERKPHA